MASDDSDIVWRRSDGGNTSEDVWDDSALIEAYDKAVGQIKGAIAERHKSKQNSGKKKKGKKKQKNGFASPSSFKGNHLPQLVDWKVGDMCRAVFSEDRLTYEAEILQVNVMERNCLVKYTGYGNTETVSFDDLLPSHGHLAKEHLERQKLEKAQMQVPNHEVMGPPENFHNKMCSSSSHHHSSHSSSERPFHPQNYHRHHHEQPSYNPPCTFAENLPQIPPPPVFPMEDGIVPEEEALASMLMSWYMSGYHTGFYQGQKQIDRRRCDCRCMHVHR